MNQQTEEIVVNIETLPNGPELKEMIDNGVFFGRKKSKTNPKLRHFIFGNRGGIEIIDLSKTLEALSEATSFITEQTDDTMFLFVGTQPAALGIIEAAKEFGMPVVEKRWIGGTLTNFKTISKRIEHFKKLKADMASGALEKYTKKERLNIDREIKRFEELLGGLEPLLRIPDAVVVIDPALHETAVREARRMRVPVIALANTDADPDVVDYMVPGNTAARKSVEWFLDKIRTALRERKKAVAAKPKEAKEAHEPKN